MADLYKPPLLKVLAVIVDREHGKRMADIFKEAHIHFQYLFSGVGTADSDILDLLGLGGVDKTIGVCFVIEPMLPGLIDRLTEKLKLNTPGRGIAFALPLSGVCSLVSNKLTKEMQEIREKAHDYMEKEVEKVSSEAKQDLIVALVNQGFTDVLMDAAKTAGATGGTIIQAHRIGIDAEAEKFFGISVQAEKEIVTILARRADKTAIMKAINQACGAHCPAKGIVFSMPVDTIAGLNFGD